MSLLIDVVKAAQDKPIGKVDDGLRNRRLSICGGCPHYRPHTKSCGGLLQGGTVIHYGQKVELCGCYLPDKTKYADDKCPIGKW